MKYIYMLTKRVTEFVIARSGPTKKSLVLHNFRSLLTDIFLKYETTFNSFQTQITDLQCFQCGPYTTSLSTWESGGGWRR